MHRSPRERRHPDQAAASLTEERLTDWRPGRISDRKLLELRNRLEKVRRLGDAFAGVRFSPELTQRLQDIEREPQPPLEAEVNTGRLGEAAR